MPNYPDTIPKAYSTHPDLMSGYKAGWQHGHGHCCHCVPSLGDRISPDVDHWGLGKRVDENNIRDYHQLLTFHRAAETRPDAAPDEDEDENSPSVHECWEAFSAGESDSIFADLSTYTPADYGLKNDPPSPFCDDDYEGNDDHIDALKEALGEALNTIHALRAAYGPLHDQISDLIEGGSAQVRATMTQATIKLIADQLAACVRADQAAKDLLASIPE